MNDEFAWWFLLVGLAVGAAATWFVRSSLTRSEEDIEAEERQIEATWISETIERAGGIAPAALVSQVLELHHGYVRSIPIDVDAPGAELGLDPTNG